MCTISFICYTILVGGYLLTCDGVQVESNTLHIHDPNHTTDYHGEDTPANCEYLDLKDVEFFEDGNIFIRAYKKIMPPSQSHIIVDDERICFNRSDELKDQIFERCFKMLFDAEDFEILLNGSVLLHKPQPEILESKTYEFDNGSLVRCYTGDDYEYSPIVTDDKIGQFETTTPVPEYITVAGPVPYGTKVENSVFEVVPVAILITLCVISTLLIKYN